MLCCRLTNYIIFSISSSLLSEMIHGRSTSMLSITEYCQCTTDVLSLRYSITNIHQLITLIHEPVHTIQHVPQASLSYVSL